MADERITTGIGAVDLRAVPGDARDRPSALPAGPISYIISDGRSVVAGTGIFRLGSPAMLERLNERQLQPRGSRGWRRHVRRTKGATRR